MILSGQNKYWGKTIEESTKYWQDLGVDHVMVKKAWDLPLITPKGDVVEENFKKLGRLQKEYGVDYHLHPYTLSVNVEGRKHYLDCFKDETKDVYVGIIKKFDKLVQQNELYPLITLHLSAMDYPGIGKPLEEKKALENTKELLSLDFMTPMDVEVIPDPYRIEDVSFVGYKPQHFKEVINGQSLCIDTGHLNMTKEPLRNFVGMGYHISSIHFHGNDGSKDAHGLPSRSNVKDVSLIEELIRRDDVVVVLELFNHGYSKDEISRLVESTRKGKIL